MDDGFTPHWPIIVIIVAALIYLEVIRRADRRGSRRTRLSDEEIITHHARSEGISELAVFQRAAKAWSVAASQAEEDFNTYLTRGELPHYVRDYIRKLDTDSGGGP